MVEKMKFISIVGPKEEIDRVTSQYLSRYEIQLENTLSELKDLKNITPCADSNPYRGCVGQGGRTGRPRPGDWERCAVGKKNGNAGCCCPD